MKINLKKVVWTTLWIMLLSQSVIWPMTNITYAAPIHSRSNFSQSEDWAIISFDLLNIPWKTWNFNDSNFWNYRTTAGYSIRTKWLTSNVTDGWVAVTAKNPIIDNNKRYKLHKIDLEWSLNIPDYQWRWSNILQTGFDIQQDMVLQVFVHWSSWLSYNWRSINDPVSKLLEYNGSWFNKTKLYTLLSTSLNTMKEPFAMFKYRNLNWERVGLFFTFPWGTWARNFKFTLDWTRGKFELGWTVYNFDISDKDFQPWYTITNTNSFLHHQTNATSYTIGFDLTKFNVDLQELGSIKITSEIASDLSKNDVDVYLFGKKQTTPVTNNKKINTIYASDWLNVKSINQLTDNGYIIASNQADVKGTVSNTDLNAYVLNADLSTAWPTRKPWMRGFYDNQGSFQPESTTYDCQWFDGTFNIPWKSPTSVTCPSNYSTIWGIGIEQAYFPWLNQSPRIHRNSSNQYYIAWYIQSQRHVATTTMDYLNYRVLPSSNSAILFFSWGYYFINNINQYSWSTIASNSTMNFGDIEWYIRDWKAWTNTYQFFTKKSNDEVQVNVFDLTKLPNAWNPNQHLKETIVLWSNQSFNLPWLKAINGFGELIYTLQETGWKVKVALWKLKSDLKEKPELLDDKEYSWMTTTGKNFIKQNAFYFGLENPSTNKTQIQGVWYIDLSQTKISKEENCDETKTYEAFAPSSFTNQNDNGKKMCYRVLDVYGNYKYVASPVISGLWPKQIRVKLNENLYDKDPVSFPTTQPEYYYKSYKVGVSFEDNKTYPDKLKVKYNVIPKTSTCNAALVWAGSPFEIEQNVERKYDVHTQPQNQSKLCFWVENVYWETHYEAIEYPYKVDTMKPTFTQNVTFYTELTRNVFVWDEIEPVIKYIDTVTDNYRTDLDKTKYEFVGWNAGLCTYNSTSKKITCSKPWTYTYNLKYYDYALNDLVIPNLTLKIHANDRSEIRTKYNLAKADVDDTKTIHNTDYTNLKTYIESSEVQEAIKTTSATADKLTKAQITTIKNKIANLNSKIIKDTTKPTGTIIVSEVWNPYVVSWVTTYYTKESPVVATLTTSEPIKEITAQWWTKTDTEGKKWKKEWTANATFIKDQSLSFEDLYGNVVATAPTYSIPIIDKVAPTLTITNPTLETNVWVAITTSTIDGNYTYSDDKTSVAITKTWVGNNPWTYDTVGTYTLKVTAKDIAWNTTVKNITIKVKEVDKTNLVSKLNALKSKLENSKVVKNSNYTTAKNWYDTNKTKGTETNLTENEMNQLITTINNHISSLTLDTTLPNKTITYSSNWSNYTKASNPKKIDFEFSDIDAGVKTIKHVLDNNTICDATLVSQMSDTTVTQTWTNPVVHKWTLSFNEETDNGKSVCFRVEDKVGNVLYHRSNQITKIDTSKPVINLTKTTETIRVGSQSTYNLRGIIQSATDTIETSINASNVVVKNITDPSTPTIANSLSNPNVWTYKFEYSLSDTAWNEAVKKVFTLKVIENDKSSLNTILTTINQKLADSKLIHNTHKTNLENYKTTINNAISNVNISENDINDIITEATKRINKLEFDTVAPTLTFDTLTPSIKVGETFNKFQGLTTTDNVDTTTSQADWNAKTTVTSSPTLNTNQVWTYTLTYKVKDEHNNEAIVTRTLKVNPVSKAWLTTDLISLKNKIDHQKTVRNSKHTDANTWYEANKNKVNDENLTQAQITALQTKANQLKNAMDTDTVVPTISFTYSTGFNNPKQTKNITVSLTDDFATTPSGKYAITDFSNTCSTLNATDYIDLPTNKKVILNSENYNGKALCVKAEDDNGNVSYAKSSKITNIDTTKPTFTLDRTTLTYNVWTYTNIDLRGNITTVTDNLSTLTRNDVVIKDITDPSNPVAKESFGDLDTGTYKVEYQVTDEAGNKSDKVVYTITVLENNKQGLRDLLDTVNQKLADSKLVHNTAKTDLENYKTTINNAIANRNLKQSQMNTIITTANNKISALTFDTTAPVITFTTQNPIVRVGESFDKFDTMNITDDIDTTTTQSQWKAKVNLTETPTLTTSTVGNYTLTYKVKDNHNNEATYVRTVKVVENDKTNLNNAISSAETVLNNVKTVRDSHYTTLKNYITALKNDNDKVLKNVNATQTQITDVINQINTYKTALSSDTTKPTISFTYSSDFSQLAKSKWIGFSATDNVATNVKLSYLTTNNTDNCSTLTYPSPETTRKVTYQLEANNSQKLCVKAEDDNQNIAYLGSNEIKKIDRTAPVITLAETTKTFKVWVHTTLNLKNNIASVSDNLETTLNANNVVIKNITDTSHPITTSTLNNIQVGTYKIEYSLTDTAGNEATKKVYTIIVQENDKTDLNNLISTINTKLSNPKLVNNSAKTDLENYKTTITNAIANRNITQTQIDTIKSNAQTKINALVFDTTAPTMTFDTLTPSIKVWETFNNFAWLTTTDNIDTSTTQEQWNTKTTVTSNPTLNTNQVGTYTLTYKVKDEHNNEATVSRTLKVNPVNKTWLTTKLNDLKAKLEHNKTVHNNAFNDATTWYTTNKTKDSEQNLTQAEMNQLITKINQLVNSLSTDTTAPTITLKTQELTTKVGETINTSKTNLIEKYIQSVTDDFTVFNDSKISANTTFNTTEIWAIDFNTVGTYTFHFTTRDDNGNATTKEVKIKVKPIDKTNLTNKLVELKNKLDNTKTIVDNKHTIATTWYNANKTKKDDVNLTQTQANQLITKIDELLSTLTTDNQKPVISGLNKLTFDLWTTPPTNYKTTGVSVSDNNPALTPTILKTRLVIDDTAVNFNQVGMYNIKYEVTDDNGNTTIQNRVVEIKTLDKAQANQCIAQLETFRETNNDTILPSLRTIINNLITSKRAITSNVNANRTQVDSVCNDINNFINNFETNYPKPTLTSSRTNIEVFVWNTPIYTWIVTANDPTDWNITSHISIDHSNVDVTMVGNYVAKYSVSNSKWRKATFNLPIKVKAHSSGSSSTSGWGSDNVVFNTQKYWVQKQETKVVETKKVENIETKSNKVSSDKNNSRELLESHIKTKKDKTTTKKSNFQDKQHEEAYNWAIKNKIIDKKTFPSSWIYNHLTRWELAVIVANFSKKLNKDKKFTKTQCSNFEDLDTVENPVIKDWMIRACEYGLMGIHSDGKTQIKNFMNTETLRRADLATVVSRMLWGTKYDDVKLKDKYWFKHLQHLSKENIIKIPDPEIKEIKQWILLMLKRYDK